MSMATLEKLVKAFEALKVIQTSSPIPDETNLSVRRKDKMQHCITIAEFMCSQGVKSTQDFPRLLSISVETLLHLCDDPDSDVRMMADESLNTIIRALTDTNIGKIQVELHKEIKKNGSARTLRAALWRFAELCHMIRPQKGKPYVVNLIPCIVQIAKRTEEPVLETLAASMQKIFKVLGCFTNDNEVKVLLKAFLHNLSSPSAVVRRTAASTILTLCLNCRKPHMFISWILNTLLDCVVPVRVDQPVPTVLGVLACLRNLLPHVSTLECHEEVMKGSFGVRKSNLEMAVGVDRMIQVYELCLHYTGHPDHNVVNAALETLHQLLRAPPPELLAVLLSSHGISRSRILPGDGQERLEHRTLSQTSMAPSLPAEDASLLDPETDDQCSLNLEPPGEDAPATTPMEESQAEEEIDDASCASVDEERSEYTNMKIGKIQDHDEVAYLRSPAPRTPAISLQSSVQSDDVRMPRDEESVTASPSSISHNVPFQVCDIGTFCDADVPLIFCTRHLAASFLLTGVRGNMMPDRNVRVSVKTLALSCIASIVNLSPDVFLLPLDKTEENGSSDEQQPLSDVLLFANHSDPQLRGITSVVIGCLMKSALVQAGGNFSAWIKGHSVTLQHLLQLLIKGLEDESSVACRHTLSALKSCLILLLESYDSMASLSVLKSVSPLQKNPYWLVKVQLVELVCELPYVTIYHLTGSLEFQEKILYNVMVGLLEDEDARVRKATASAIVKIVPLLFFPLDYPGEDAITAKGALFSSNYLSPIVDDSCLPQKPFVNGLPSPFNVVKSKPYKRRTDSSLSRVVNHLSQTLLMSASKFLTYGCCEALTALSMEYLTTAYPRAWNCILVQKSQKKPSLKRSSSTVGDAAIDSIASPACGLLSTSLTLLMSSPVALDLSSQQWLMQLAGNLLSGMGVCSLKGRDPANSSEDSHKHLWSVLSDKRLASAAEQLLVHTVRTLNIFVHVLEEVIPVVPTPKPTLPSLPTAPSLSPIKRKSKVDSTVSTDRSKLMSPSKPAQDKDEKPDEKKTTKGTAMGFFANLPHYMKIYDILKSAYTNYKITLDSRASEKFVTLLEVTLDTLSQLLEIGSLNEMGRIAEELLSYLRSTVVVASTCTIKCVQQLLKCLFGTNLCAQWEEAEEKRLTSWSSFYTPSDGFYNTCFHAPYSNLTETVTSSKPLAASNVEREEGSGWMSYLRKKGERKMHPPFKTFGKSSDQASLASYIRLFEPMVIKALKQYTITSDTHLQCQVLLLLSQLVQLRVNYCLLDSDQIFIGFVLKQFEFIEEGQIPHAEELIPRIFYFLVHLSYEKYHSKLIIGIPKVIRLCDGLMASGQSPTTHCIPALVPVVEDVFLARGSSSSSSDLKELDTQRDFLVSMLLRLVEYHQVLELLSIVLTESHDENEEKWRRWSRQVMDALLPLLAHGRVHLETRMAQHALHRLLNSAAPSVLRPVDPLLRVLFSEPPSMQSSLVVVQRWLGMVLGMLLVLISQGKEEVVLGRLEELELFIPTHYDYVDPLNVGSKGEVSPEVVMARFMFRVIGLVSSKIYSIVFTPSSVEDCGYLQEQFAHFLLYCIYMLQSGSYCKVANAAMEMVKNVGGEETELPLDDINALFLELAAVSPLLTFEWCYLLVILNYSSQEFWGQVLLTTPAKSEGPLSPFQVKNYGPSPCCNLEVVRKGGIILFCDFVCENLSDVEQMTWLLVNHIQEVIQLSAEPPVQEFIAAVHRSPGASCLLVQAVASRCEDVTRPSLVRQLLKCLEGVHPSQSGSLLTLIVGRLLAYPQLALARLAGNLACQRAEMLLTSTMEEVKEQLPQQDFQMIMDTLQSLKLTKKHSRLVSLLNKLGSQCYDLSPLELEQGRTFNPANVKSVLVDKNWYLSQVKLQCCRPKTSGTECAQLLSKLDFEGILSVMATKEFNIYILEDCLKLGTHLTLQACQGLSTQRVGYNDTSTYIDSDKTSTLESPLYRAAKLSLLQHVSHIKSMMPRQHQVYSPLGRKATSKESKYSNRIGELFSDAEFWDTLFQIVPAVTCYLGTLSKLAWTPDVPGESWDDVAKFGVLCLEAVHWLITHEKKPPPHYIHMCLLCTKVILEDPNLSGVIGLPQNITWVASSAGGVTKIIQFLQKEELVVNPPSAGLQKAFEDPECICAAHTCHQMATLVSWLERTKLQMDRIPDFLSEPLKSLVVSLARMPLVNSYVVTPPQVWLQGWDIEFGGPTKTRVPPLPVEYLQEEVLEQFIFRVTLLGWISRQQFEETWMALLGVLSSNPSEDAAPEEVSVIIQACSQAVQAITAILIQTLLLPMPGNPSTSALVHQPRERLPIQNSSNGQKLKAVHELLSWRLQEQHLTSHLSQFQHVFQRGNLERVNSHNRYGYSQVSLEYLWTATRILEEVNEEEDVEKHKGRVSWKCLEREQCLAASGLDLHSCLHFLLDLYSQWTVPQSRTPLRLLTEAVRSVLAISDLFTEKAQFQWMLDTCLELHRGHPLEDEILNQYIVLGACKAAAVLGPDSEVFERVKKMVEASLKSSFLPTRIAGLHGILYLLQSGVMTGQGTELKTNTESPKSHSEEMLLILPLAIEYIQKHIDNSNTPSNQSEEHVLVMWSLVFFLLENVEEEMNETDVAPSVLQLVLGLVASSSLPSNLHLSLLQGLERLVVTKSIGGKVCDQVTKLAVERLRHPNPNVSLPALQLLLSCMYIGQSQELQEKTEGESGDKGLDPELLMQAMERTSALFDRIKKGYPFEVELLCGVLPTLLTDFFPPSEILNKVIGEFLSTQQPHPRLLADVVFQVFDQACQQSQLSLLQDWVVDSLSNFTQCSPVGMAMWYLMCFFISASTNPWLRAIFPHVQSRIGRCEYEDRKLLCIAASDFYNQLTDEGQKQTFISTFQAAAQPQSPFADLIACL